MAKATNGLRVFCAHDRMIALNELRENPANPNRHPPEQIALLAKIIREQGWRNPIVVSTRSGLITKGHARLYAARALGLEQAPVDYQDYASEKQELADMVADNRIAELAELDRSGLRDIMEQLDDGSFDMDLTGFDQAALEELMSATMPGSDVDAEPQIDKADELREKWGVERGQVWELGAHRLMCGDSTETLDCRQLHGRDPVPTLMVTDPPYGTEYDPHWRDNVVGEFGTAARGNAAVNDDKVDWSQAFALFQGAVAYVWHAGRFAALIYIHLESAGFEIRSQIIWAKQHFALSRGHYHWQHEPCWYAIRKGKSGGWCGDRTQSTLWEISSLNPAGRKEERFAHGTQKPLECMARPIRNNSNVGEAVYDPFVGSGTTILACEQLGRKCRAMEIDPGYCAVSIQRWADATGKTPQLIS